MLTIFWKQQGQDVTYEVNSNLTGAYNTENMLAAVALGLHFDLSPEQINQGLSSYVPQNNRSQVVKTMRNTVIADYYNANASSMAAALANIAVIEAPKKVIILGDMFEMGDESEVEHRKVIEQAKSIAAEQLIFVGKAFYALRDDSAEYYESTEDLRQSLASKSIADATILLKASRGMAFENLMDLL